VKEGLEILLSGDSMSDQVKQMAALLKGGAKMLASTCPECGTILFQVGDGIICPKCNKRVITSKDDNEKAILERNVVLYQTEQIITNKIDEIQRQLSDKDDPKELVEIATLLSMFLEILERIKRIRGSH
jgi:UPF0148 protein